VTVIARQGAQCHGSRYTRHPCTPAGLGGVRYASTHHGPGRWQIRGSLLLPRSRGIAAGQQTGSIRSGELGRTRWLWRGDAWPRARACCARRPASYVPLGSTWQGRQRPSGRRSGRLSMPAPRCVSHVSCQPACVRGRRCGPVRKAVAGKKLALRCRTPCPCGLASALKQMVAAGGQK